MNGYTNANGILNRGVLNMNNNNVWAVSNVDFNAYEVDGVVKWNTISNLGNLGFGFNNRINIHGNVELSGTNKDIFTNNGDIALVRYKPDWNVGSQIRLKDNTVAINNLTVEGALNCYELVANKVRSTNGYLYVTDSTPILEVLYVGYNNKGEAEAKILIEDSVLREGDYVILQKVTDKGVTKLSFFCSWAETS